MTEEFEENESEDFEPHTIGVSSISESEIMGGGHELTLDLQDDHALSGMLSQMPKFQVVQHFLDEGDVFDIKTITLQVSANGAVDTSVTVTYGNGASEVLSMNHIPDLGTLLLKEDMYIEEGRMSPIGSCGCIMALIAAIVLAILTARGCKCDGDAPTLPKGHERIASY